MRTRNFEPTKKLWKLQKLINEAAIFYAHNLTVWGVDNEATVTAHEKLLALTKLDRRYSDAHMEMENVIIDIEQTIKGN